MLPETVAMTVSLAAIATKGLIASMNPDVIGQSRLLTKSLSALFTLKRLLARVDPLMPNQAGLSNKDVATISTSQLHVA